MKKIWIVIILVMIFLVFFFTNNKEKKLEKIGYSSKEVSVIVSKVKDYNLITNYKRLDKLTDILNDKNYKDENLKKYLDYYIKNKNSDISDIIVIVNSNYDVLNYPASNLLASLVKEKYYINDNVARYLDYGNNHQVDSNKIVAVVNSKADYEFYTHTKASNLDDGNLVLVNKFNYLPNNYEPNDLVKLEGQYNGGANNMLRKEAALAFMKMVSKAKLDNIIIKNASAYRSYHYQVNLYNNYVIRDGSKLADIYSARPGFSEHQTGLCLDINNIDASFAKTNEARWLKNNAYKFGFILRFPEDKVDVTGYKFEAWHYRYVGLKAAKIIYKDNLTLEEYYAYYVKK
jgi:D-alanyl-D-alanine carboxypeptidase